MTVFNCEEMSSATTRVPTEKECEGSCSCGRMNSFTNLKELSSGFSFRSVSGDLLCIKINDGTETEAERKVAEKSKSGTALLHDHSYTKFQTRRKASSASSDDSSSEMDESLQDLFDTCELDRDFLAEAKPAFRQFLDDVLDSSDVPATDDLFFFDLEEQDSSHRVPTRSSSLSHHSGPPTSPCLFTCAGSTDTLLSSSVSRLRVNDMTSSMTSSSTSRVPLFDCTSSLPCVSSSFSSSFDFASNMCALGGTPSSVPDCSALDSKLKGVIDFLFDENAAASDRESEVTTFLTERDDVTRCNAHVQQPLSFSDTLVDEFVQPVTLSHRIQGGKCVNCSTLKTHGGEGGADGITSPSISVGRNSVADSSATTAAPTPSAIQSQQHSSYSSSLLSSSLSSSPLVPTGLKSGKRKLSDSESVENDTCDKRARFEPSVCDSDRLKDVDLTAETSSVPDTVVSSSEMAASNLSLFDLVSDDSEEEKSLKVLGDEKGWKVREKHSEGVLDYLSFVRNTKLPLSPIHLHHFGRHG